VNKQTPATILIVEDDLDIADMLNAYFHVQGYDVVTVNWGEDAITHCQQNLPDLIILDIRLPDIDGFEVAKRVRANRRTKEVPIIFLTEKRQREDRLQGLSLHAEDYITKPFDIQELRLRVRNSLMRHQRGALINAVTGLPERQFLIEELEKWLIMGDFAMMMVSIKNLPVFREVYGFIASDDLLRALVIMLRDNVTQYSGEHNFLAHLESENFVMLLPIGDQDKLVERIEQSITKSFDYFYNERDREAGRFENKLDLIVHSWVIRSGNENLQTILAELDQKLK